ncbi:MFS transporter [Amycolatopsis sp. H6(2020)]|nr:MFS transporter [Amycolatopsis sp. H6(2020)]
MTRLRPARLLELTLGRPLPTGPERLFVVTVFTTLVGQGMWLTCAALFLTRSVGLSPTQVGLALLVGGIAGLVVATPAGTAADWIGPRRLMVGVHLVRAAAMLLFALAGSFWSVLVIVCLYMIGNSSAMAVRAAFATGLSRDGGRVRALARLQVGGRIGQALGAVAGAVAIQADTRPAYLAMLAFNAVTYLAAAVLTWRLPEVPPVAREQRTSLTVLRDTPYLSVMALFAVLTLNWGLLSVGIPLWTVQHTEAPRWTVGAILVINGVAIALMQIRFARSADTPTRSAVAGRRAGVLLAVSCVLFALSGSLPEVPAVVLLLAGGVVHAVGELLYAAGFWGLSVGLMPETARGEYQGLAAAGSATAETVSPLIMTSLLIDGGQSGWFVLGALFLLAGLGIVQAAKWSMRRPARLD